MKTNKKSAEFQPNHVLSYFKAEWRALLIVTVSGLIYNIGLLTGPWFEDTMTGYLVEILNGTGQFSGMLMLVISFAVWGIGDIFRGFGACDFQRFGE